MATSPSALRRLPGRSAPPQDGRQRHRAEAGSGRGSNDGRHGQHQGLHDRDRQRRQRPLRADRESGGLARRSLRFDPGAQRHGAALGRKRRPGKSACAGGADLRGIRRSGCQCGRQRHGRDRAVGPAHLRHCRHDRRDRLPDQPAGPQCRGRGGAGRRGGPRLCRRGRRGARPGAAFQPSLEGDQDADRELQRRRSSTAWNWSTRPAVRSARS